MAGLRFGRWFGSLFSTAGGFAVGAATADSLKPGLQEVVNTAWAAHPALPLAPEIAARADRRGTLTPAEAKAEAKLTGVNADRYATLYALTRTLPSAQTFAELALRGFIPVADARTLAGLGGTEAADFDRLYDAAGNVPATESLLELQRRGAANPDEVDDALRFAGMRPTWRGKVQALARALPPVTDTIRFAVRDVFQPDKRAALQLDAEYPVDLTPRARQLGLTEEDAKNYWAAHWDLPSYTQGANMMFRGEITAAEFADLLRALDYAPKWREPLANIARAIPSMSDFIRFAVREVFDAAQRARLKLDQDYPAAFTAKAALHGLTEEDARDYWAAHWQLPSPTQGYHMLWRDEIDAAGLDDLLKALDYSPTWRDKLANIARPVLGRVDIRRAHTLGVLDRAGVEHAYRQLGYEGDSLDALVKIATAPAHSSASVKDLTASQLATEYEGGFSTAAEFRTGLLELGYPDAEITRYVALGDARRVSRARSAAIGRIKSSYVGHKIPREEAAAALVKEVASADTRELLLAEWDNELAVNVRTLTQAQILKLFKKGIYDRPTALDELTDIGMDDADANHLLDAV